MPKGGISNVPFFRVTKRTDVDGQVYGLGVYPDLPVNITQRLRAKEAGFPVDGPGQDAKAKAAPAPAKPKPAPAVPIIEQGKKGRQKATKPATSPAPETETTGAGSQGSGEQAPAPETINIDATAEEVDQTGEAGTAETADASQPGELDPETAAKVAALNGPLPENLPGAADYRAAGIETIETLISLDAQTLLTVPGIDEATVQAGSDFLLAMAKAK